MRYQGLPINFIVLAAIAVMVLILAVTFVVGGGSSFSTALSPTQAKQACDNFCMNFQNEVISKPWSYNYDFADDRYCKYNTIIRGQTGRAVCVTLSPCYVTFSDGASCQVKCYSGTGSNESNGNTDSNATCAK